MLFDFDLTIPAGTLATAPVLAKAHLIAGTITEIRVKFPPGPATLVHVVIKDKSFQLMPINPEATLNVDDETVTDVLEYPLTEAPYDLDLMGWSPTAVFAHTITFQFQMAPLKHDQWSDFIEQLFEPGKIKPKG